MMLSSLKPLLSISMKNSSQIIWIFLAVLMELSALGMMIPVIPYTAGNYGASALQIGLLMSIYSAVQCLVSPFWGRWSDRAGRKPVLLLSMFCTSLSYLWFYFSPSLLHLFLSRAFAGAMGVSVSTSFAFISDLTERKGRSKNMALVGAAFGLGFVIGPLLGGVLDHYTAFGAGLVCLLGLLIGIFKIKESYSKTSPRKPSSAPSDTSYFLKFSMALKDSSLRKLLFLFFILSIGLTLVEAPLFLLMKDQFDWPQSWSSLGFAYIGFILAVTQGFFVRSWIPLFGEKKVNLWGLFLLAFGLFGLCIPDLRWTAGAVTLLALGFACSYTCLTGMISLITKKTHQGSVLGVHQSVSSISRILGPVFGGWIYGKWGYQILFLFAGIVVIAGFLLSFFFRKWLPSAVQEESPLEDYGVIQSFQLNNLIQNQVPFSLFCLSQKEKLPSALSDSAQKLLKLSQSVQEEDLLQRSFGDQPVVLICEDGLLSRKLSLKLLKKWTNVFYLKGGLLKYNKEKDS